MRRAKTNLSIDCEIKTAESHVIGQIEGANESVEMAINTAINIRECQLDIRIKYIARKRSETVICYNLYAILLKVT